MEPGFSFPLGPKDEMLTKIKKNINPGPGAHNILKQNFCLINANKTMGCPLPPKPQI